MKGIIEQLERKFDVGSQKQWEMDDKCDWEAHEYWRGYVDAVVQALKLCETGICSPEKEEKDDE